MKHANPIQSSAIRLLLSVLALLISGQAGVHAQSIWIGTNGVSANTNWSTPANWSTGQVPDSTNQVRFLDEAATTISNINNVVNIDRTVASVQYTATNGSHTTLIPAGRTLTVLGNFAVGTELQNFLNTLQPYATVTGAGTLLVSNAAGNLIVRQGVDNTIGNGSQRATLDMSGLDTFTADVATVVVGAIQVVNTRQAGTLFLAKTNHIRATTAIHVAQNTSNPGGANFVHLGQTNAFFTPTVNIGRRKTTGTVQFHTNLVNPAAFFRGADGVGRVTTWNIGDNSEETGTTGSAATGTMNFTGGLVDAMVGTMQIGRSKNGGASGAGHGNGTLTFNSGTFNVNTIELGFQNATSFASGFGNLNVNGGTLIVNNNLRMGFSTGGDGAPGTRGFLTINGGTVMANSIPTGAASTNNVIRMSSGVLIVTNSVGPNIHIFAVTNSTLTLPVSATPTVGVTNLQADGANTIHVSTVPLTGGYPMQFKLIDYTAAEGNLNSFTLGSLPGIFQGYISNNLTDASVDLVVTNGPVFLGPLTWSGRLGVVPNGTWDQGLTTNWLVAGNPTAYQDGNPVTFDDSALGETNVSLSGTLSPSTTAVNNSAKQYTLGGSGGLAGPMSFTKLGSGTLTLDFTGAGTFSGGFAISNGIVQVGPSGGGFGTGALVNEGTLIFNRTNTLTVSSTLSGAGAITNNGSGLVNLAGAGADFNGNVAVNAGTLRLGTANSGGNTPVFYINPGGTLAVSGAATNSVMVVNGTLAGGSADFDMSDFSELTVPAGTVAILRSFDPLNPATSRNIQVDGILHGSGTILVRNADNVVNPDSQQGVRFRGTTSSDFTGSIIYTNNTKGEIQVTGSGPFTPVNTGKFFLYAGAYDGGNALTAPAVGGYMEFNIRNTAGSSDIPSDFEILGSGAVVFNGLGGGGIATLGNLRIGGGQEIIGYRGASTITNTIAFSSVTLTGGTVTFSPHSPTFGVANQAGTHLTLNDVSQTAPSSLVVNGRKNLTLTGTINYSGTTVVSNGFLVVSAFKNAAAGITLEAGGSLTGTGALNESVVINGGTLIPGDLINSPLSSLNLGGGNLTLNSNTNIFTLGSSGSSSAVFGIGTLSINGTCVLDLRVDPFGTFATGDTFTLFNFTGSLPSSVTNNLQILPVAGYSFSVVNPATTPGTLRVRIDHAIKNLTWVGCVNANWDLTTINWNDAGGLVCNSLFTNLDNVTFVDDVRTNVVLVGKLEPGQMRFANGFENMFWGGSGYVSGSGGLRLDGSQPVYIANTGTNDFTGPVLLNSAELQVISGGLGTGGLFMTNSVGPVTPSLVFKPAGTLEVPNNISGNQGSISHTGVGTTRLNGTNTHTTPITVSAGTLAAGTDSALGTINGSTTIEAGATLDVNGRNLGSEQVIVAGGGVGGLGAIVNNGTNASTQALRFVTVTDNVTFGGQSRWDIRGSAAALLSQGFSFNITKKGTNQISLVAVTNITADLLDIDIQEGTFAIQTTTTQVGNPGGTITIHTNATLNLFNLNVNPLNKQISVQSGGTIWNENNNGIIIGPITLDGIANFNVAGTGLILSNNTVTVSGGTLSRFTKTSGGSLQFVGNNLPSAQTYEILGGTLDLSRANVTNITLGSGQLLRGHAAIEGSLFVGSGATLEAGPNGTNAIGTLRVNEAIVLQPGSLTALQIDANSTTSDLIVATNLTLGGSLTVGNVGGTFTAGMSFRLFAAQSLGGNFSSVVLPTLSLPLFWTNTITTDGRITVWTTEQPVVIQTPRIVNAVRSGSNLILSGTNGTTNGTFYVITSTNIATPLTNWTIVSTNTFSASGTFNVTNAIDPARPRQFFDLLQQVP